MGILHALPIIEDVDPWHGVPGDVISLIGTGFLSADHEVDLNGNRIPLEPVDDNNAQFRIPDNASTGPLILSDGTSEGTILDLFWVTREIEVGLHESLGWANHVGSAFGDSESANAPYTVTVGKGRMTVVAAATSEEEPLGLAIALSEHTIVDISPESTVLALLFLHPQINDQTGEGLDSARERMENLPAYRKLLGMMNESLAAGSSWIQAPGLNDMLEILYEEYLSALSVETSNQSARQTRIQSYPQTAGRFESKFSFTENTPRDLKKTNFAALERLVPKVGSDQLNVSGEPILAIKMDPGTVRPFDGIPFWDGRFSVNPLDWTVNIYKLDPNQPLLDSPEAIRDLKGSWTRAYDRLQATPVDSFLVPATLITENADIWGTIKKKIIKVASPGNLVTKAFKYQAPKSQLEIPADESGLYLIRAFSGARMELQKDLILSLPDGEAEDWAMFKWNIIIGAQDFILTMMGSHPALKDRDLIKNLLKIGNSSMASIERQYVSEGQVLGPTQAVSISKVILDRMSDYLLDRIRKLGPSLSGGVKLKASNATTLTFFYTLVKAGSKASERFLALSNGTQLLGGVLENSYMAMGVEETIVVVGDPWIPVVETFLPTEGHRGSEVRITGRNFSPTPGENVVTFGALTTDPVNPSEPQRAEVLSATKNELVVKVPEDSDTGPITVAKVGGHSAFNTTALRDPYKVFSVTGEPVITEIFPAEPRPGTKILVRGENLGRDHARTEVYFGAGLEGPATVFATRPSGLIVKVPDMEGANSVTVTINDRDSNSFPFIISIPANDEGALITVTDPADNNVRNDKLSLREAMMLANGELSVAELTQPPQDRPPGVSYESDGVSKFTPPPGPDVANTIHIRVEEIALSSPLPVVGDYDILYGGGFIYGKTLLNGSASSGPGLVYDGTDGSSIERLNFTGFPGPAILVTGGAAYNDIGGRLGADIRNGASHGVALMDDAFNNRINVGVTNNAGHGVLLSGENVLLNTLPLLALASDRTPLGSNGGWGVKIENGASFNEILPFGVIGNQMGGIHVHGSNSEMNLIGPSGGNGAIPIDGNGGPGVLVEAPDTVLNSLQISSNQGHGIHFQSADSAGSMVHTAGIGYKRERSSPDPLPNTGDGIRIDNGAHNIRIGFADPDLHEPGYSPAIAGNLGSGIVIDGASTHSIHINSAHIGMGVGRTDLDVNSSPYFPNGAHGIHITNGSHDNFIGAAADDAVRIRRNQNGAGIRIDTNSHDNTIVSGYIDRNQNGIVLADQAYGNRIGIPGSSLVMDINNNDESGIVLSSAFNPTGSIPPDGTPFEPQGRNVIQGAVIQNNDSGIRILNGARANLIGGPGPADGNLFQDNSISGIHIDGVVITRPEFSNRIENNRFRAHLNRTPSLPRSVLTADPAKVGILVNNGASGNIIGGTTPASGNDFTKLHHGIFIDRADGNIVRNNDFTSKVLISPAGYEDLWRNYLSGVLIRFSNGNFVGPDNIFLDCGETGSEGSPPPASGIWNTEGGGVVITGGGSNTVAGNLFGVNRERDRWIGNHPDGIQIHFSSNNIIGGAQLDEANAIVLSDRYGILVRGVNASGNRIGGNSIGLDIRPEQNPARPNGFGGIMLEVGAFDNVIGGELPIADGAGLIDLPAPNEILYNDGEGILVDGAATVGNRIIDNIISEHAGEPGILLSNGGNAMLPAPGLVFENGMLNGTSTAPDGSLVQIFSDPEDEGAVLLGETLVAGGSFNFNPNAFPFPVFTATVTDLNNNTSPFAIAVSPPPDSGGITIKRFGMQAERNAGTSGGMTMAVPVEILGSGISAMLDSVKVTESGSLNAKTGVQGIMLFQDLDQDGKLGGSDIPVSDALQFDSDNGSVEFEDLSIPIDANQPLILLIAVALTADAVPGSELELSVANSGAVSFKGVFSSQELQEVGEYPIPGDTLTVVDDSGLDSFDQWLLPQLSPEELQDPHITNPEADLDLDGVATLMEFLFQTDPFDPLDSPDIRMEVVDESTFVVRFNHLDVPSDIVVELLATYNFSNWMNLGSVPEVIEVISSPSPIGGESLTVLLEFTDSKTRVFLKLHAGTP